MLINALNLVGQYSGVQNYINNLLTGLYTTDLSDLSFVPLLQTNISGSYARPGYSPYYAGAMSRIGRIAFEQVLLKNVYERRACNLYHSTSYVLPFFWRLPSVVTVHDLIAIQFPELTRNSTALYYNMMLRHSCNKATRIIAVSNKVKSDLVEIFKIPEDRVAVIYLGIHSRFKRMLDDAELLRVRVRYRLPARFILFVGNIEPKKNLLVILKAFKMLREDPNVDHKLVIVGRKAWKYKTVFTEVERLRLKDDVRFLGYLDEDDLPAVYSLSQLFLFPSIYEGFGLPPLEAMACETPVIVSRSGSLPEITGDICPQVDCHSANNLFEEMYDIINKGCTYNLQEAARRALGFTRERMASDTRRLYSEILS